MLRLFNDCFAVAALFISIYAYQRRIWTLGSIAYSWGVGIKMSLLLALPGVVMILGQGLPINRALRNVAIMLQMQVRVHTYPIDVTEAAQLISYRHFLLFRFFLPMPKVTFIVRSSSHASSYSSGRSIGDLWAKRHSFRKSSPKH